MSATQPKMTNTEGQGSDQGEGQDRHDQGSSSHDREPHPAHSETPASHQDTLAHLRDGLQLQPQPEHHLDHKTNPSSSLANQQGDVRHRLEAVAQRALSSPTLWHRQQQLLPQQQPETVVTVPRLEVLLPLAVLHLNLLPQNLKLFPGPLTLHHSLSSHPQPLTKPLSRRLSLHSRVFGDLQTPSRRSLPAQQDPTFHYPSLPFTSLNLKHLILTTKAALPIPNISRVLGRVVRAALDVHQSILKVTSTTTYLHPGNITT